MAESESVVPSATGVVSYSVDVECPSCHEEVTITAWPYTDDSSEYYDQETDDNIGLAVFGGRDVPAKWERLNFKFRCRWCYKEFTLTGLEL